MRPKYKLFIDEYSRNGNILRSAIKAGFAETYARAEGKSILNRALRYQANELNKRANSDTVIAKEGKQLMYEILGMTRKDLIDNVKYLSTQEKDLATRLKVIKPLVKEIDIDLSDEIVSNTTVPILNISVSKNDNADNGLTEPQTQESKE